MSKNSKMTLAAELMRKGGILLKDQCPKCGGLQVQYRMRTLCTNCDDLAEASKVVAPATGEAVASLKDLVTTKINETCNLLGKESDAQNQIRLAELILRYLEILDKSSKMIEERKAE